MPMAENNMFKLTRFFENPILSPKGTGWESLEVFNPGVIWKDNKAYMLYRAVGEHDSYISRFGLATSDDGYHFTRASDTPVFEPGDSYDAWGVEDPRIVELDGTIYVTYVAVGERIMENGKPLASRKTALVTSGALISTSDFKSFTRHGIITPFNSDNKDTVLFPEKINGRYAILHRPHFWTKPFAQSDDAKLYKIDWPCEIECLPMKPSVWISFSDDLKTWDSHAMVFNASHDTDAKIGPGIPPLRTEAGWLLIYHHVIPSPTAYIYETKAALLDLNNPHKVIAKIPYSILAPEMDYEKKGWGPSEVTFPSGGFIKDKTLFVYYGASDSNCALATGNIDELLTELKAHPVLKQ